MQNEKKKKKKGREQKRKERERNNEIPYTIWATNHRRIEKSATSSSPRSRSHARNKLTFDIHTYIHTYIHTMEKHTAKRVADFSNRTRESS